MAIPVSTRPRDKNYLGNAHKKEVRATCDMRPPSAR